MLVILVLNNCTFVGLDGHSVNGKGRLGGERQDVMVLAFGVLSVSKVVGQNGYGVVCVGLDFSDNVEYNYISFNGYYGM